MDVSPEDIAYVRTVFDALVDAWVRFGRPEPRSVERARSILDRALTWSMSQPRHDFEPDDPQSEVENIGSREVAEMYGLTPRTVQRNAKLYGGQKVSGVYVFQKDELGERASDAG